MVCEICESDACEIPSVVECNRPAPYNQKLQGSVATYVRSGAKIIDAIGSFISPTGNLAAGLGEHDPRVVLSVKRFTCSMHYRYIRVQ